MMAKVGQNAPGLDGREIGRFSPPPGEAPFPFATLALSKNNDPWSAPSPAPD